MTITELLYKAIEAAAADAPVIAILMIAAMRLEHQLSACIEHTRDVLETLLEQLDKK